MLYNKKQIIESLVEPTDTNVYWALIIPNSSEPPILKTFYNGVWIPITSPNTNNLNGSNYLMVYGIGTPEENAAELQAAYDEAKTMPRYVGSLSLVDDRYTIYKGQTFFDTESESYYIANSNFSIGISDGNITLISEAYAKSIRTTLLVAPGYYNFPTEFVHNQSGINIKSLSGDSDVYISAIDANMNYVFGIETDFTEISGLVTTHTTYPSYGVAAIRVAPNLKFDLVVKKCISGIYSFWDNDRIHNNTYYGTFIDCVGGAYSFVSGTGIQTLSGTLIRCKATAVSFGCYAILENVIFEDCEGEQFCFGYTDGEATATIKNTAVFKNCSALNNSFGYGATTNQGKYYYCINTGANSGVLNGSISLYCSKNGVI